MQTLHGKGSTMFGTKLISLYTALSPSLIWKYDAYKLHTEYVMPLKAMASGTYESLCIYCQELQENETHYFSIRCHPIDALQYSYYLLI